MIIFRDKTVVQRDTAESLVMPNENDDGCSEAMPYQEIRKPNYSV